MIEKQSATYRISIYMSGPIEVAKQSIRQFVRRGLCVTIEPTLFIYTGGEEQGFVIGLLNYPRFPAEPEKLNSTAIELARKLLEATEQDSVLIVMPTETKWITGKTA